MEAMDIYITAAKDISHLIISHPIYSAFGSFILLAILLNFYCRLTVGICRCDQDMTGKTVLITGASAGIGKETARDLARRNARVLLACRNVAKAEKVADEIKTETGNANVIVKCLDLCSFSSVRKCAEDVLRTEDRLDVLINNAGISDLIQKSAPSRIINVASAAKNFANLDTKDLTNSKMKSKVTVYSNSKLANVLFTRELAERLSGTGVTVNALHPGCVDSDIFSNSYDAIALFSKTLFLIVGKTIKEGAQTTINLAVDPELEKTTGKYFADCKEEKLRKEDTDRALARSLFEISEQIVGASFTKP